MKKMIRSFLFLLLLTLALSFAACKGSNQTPQDLPDEIPAASNTNAPAGSDVSLPNDSNPQTDDKAPEEQPADNEEPIEEPSDGKEDADAEETAETDPIEDDPYATPTDPESEEAIAQSSTRVELPFIPLP